MDLAFVVEAISDGTTTVYMVLGALEVETNHCVGAVTVVHANSCLAPTPPL
jgi:hypothetical protein